jgi:phage tail-like protein
MITDPTSLHLYRRFNFQLEIDGAIRAGFSEVSGLSADPDVVDYRQGQETRAVPRKLPGLSKHTNIVLKRGVTADPSLWDWRQKAIAGEIRRLTGAVIHLDEVRRPLTRWTFHAGWPAKWEGPSLNAKPGEVAIETLEIAHEGLEL